MAPWRKLSGQPFSIKPKNPKDPSRAFITGGPCDGAKARCSYVARVNNAPLAGVAPAMTGGRSAWVWHYSDHKSEVSAASLWRGASDNLTGQDWLPDFAVYQAMSKRLPEWVYIYLAPGRRDLARQRQRLPQGPPGSRAKVRSFHSFLREKNSANSPSTTAYKH